jgi:hypothetical protein
LPPASKPRVRGVPSLPSLCVVEIVWITDNTEPLLRPTDKATLEFPHLCRWDGCSGSAWEEERVRAVAAALSSLVVNMPMVEVLGSFSEFPCVTGVISISTKGISRLSSRPNGKQRVAPTIVDALPRQHNHTLSNKM